MASENYTEVCVLRRCGQLDGKQSCCAQIKDAGLDKIVMDYLWTSIYKDNCAQYFNGVCLSRQYCESERSYCYPIPLRKKRVNRTVIVMFAYYCADQAELFAADVDAADVVEAAAYVAAADADVDADAYVATVAAAYVAAYVAADAVVTAAYDAADVVVTAAYDAADVDAVEAYVDAADAAVAARELFFREAAAELEKLIDAWGEEQ